MEAFTIIRDLLTQMEWADATVWNSVHELGSNDENLRKRLEHFHQTQHAFMDIWKNRPFDPANYRDRDFAGLEQWTREYYDELHEFVANLDVSSLDTELPIPWGDRFAKGAKPVTLGESMLQVASHSTHHRGQVNTRIRELGAKPPLVDYIAWLWYGRPAPQWAD